MPFQFSLRALLRLRRIQEQRERLRLSLLTTSRGRLRKEHDETGHRRMREFEELERRLQTGMPGAEFQLKETQLQNISKQQRELAALLQALELQVKKQVETFWESQKKRKILDSLADREHRAYQQIQDRREQQRIDDLFAQRQIINLND